MLEHDSLEKYIALDSIEKSVKNAISMLSVLIGLLMWKYLDTASMFNETIFVVIVIFLVDILLVIYHKLNADKQ